MGMYTHRRGPSARSLQRRLLQLLIAIMCTLWIQGYAGADQDWSAADDILMTKLATAGGGEDLNRLIRENEATFTERWLYEAAFRAYRLESNYTDDRGLRITAVVRDIARAKGFARNEAIAVYERGGILLDYRYSNAEAERSYTEALELFRRTASVLWQARCINRLGDIAFRKSDYRTADERFQEALPL